MPHLTDPLWIAAAVTLIVQGLAMIRYFYRKTRDNDIYRTFVRDVALNHLPFIYKVLRQLAEQQGIEIDDAPPMRFVEINGKNGNGNGNGFGSWHKTMI